MGARRQRNQILIALAIILVTSMLANCTGCSSARRHSLNRAFVQIKDGDPEDRVRGLMGKPDRVLHPGDSGFWPAPEGCVKQYMYQIHILPEQWVISFNEQGRVIYRSRNVF
jgi:hypothetical protein